MQKNLKRLKVYSVIKGFWSRWMQMWICRRPLILGFTCSFLL